MSEEQAALTRLVRDIFNTRDAEIQCQDARIMMVRCADVLLSDNESRRQYPLLWHHFYFCPNCAEEYRLLMELARLEAAGQLERPAQIPPPPDEGRPTIWAQARDAITALFPGFSPVLVEAVTRGEEPMIEPVTVALGQGELQIAFDLATNEDNTNLRDLFCTVSTEDEALEASFEGSSVWLQIEDQGPAAQEQALDELGDVAFSGLSPGRYALRLHLAGREYVVRSIELP